MTEKGSGLGSLARDCTPRACGISAHVLGVEQRWHAERVRSVKGEAVVADGLGGAQAVEGDPVRVVVVDDRAERCRVRLARDGEGSTHRARRGRTTQSYSPARPHGQPSRACTRPEAPRGPASPCTHHTNHNCTAGEEAIMSER